MIVWDFSIYLTIGMNLRCIEWMGCCCGGAESAPKGEEHLFPVSPIVPCRDVMFQHPRTKACDLLAELPSSMPLDSGYSSNTLLSSPFSIFGDDPLISPTKDVIWTKIHAHWTILTAWFDDNRTVEGNWSKVNIHFREVRLVCPRTMTCSNWVQ